MLVNIKGYSLIRELPSLCDDKKFVDVLFICAGNTKVWAHKLVLLSVSSLLKDIFEDQLARTTEIFIPDFSSVDVENVLRYVYEGTVRLQKSEIEQFKSLCLLLNIEFPMVVHFIDSDDERVERWQVKRPKKTRKASCPYNSEVPSKVKRIYREVGKENRCDISGNPHHIARTDKDNGLASKQLPEPIPLKHFKNFVCKLEKKKAEKNIRKLVEEIVHKQLAKKRKCIKCTEEVNCKRNKNATKLDSLKYSSQRDGCSQENSELPQKTSVALTANQPKSCCKGTPSVEITANQPKSCVNGTSSVKALTDDPKSCSKGTSSGEAVTANQPEYTKDTSSDLPQKTSGIISKSLQPQHENPGSSEILPSKKSEGQTFEVSKPNGNPPPQGSSQRGATCVSLPKDAANEESTQTVSPMGLEKEITKMSHQNGTQVAGLIFPSPVQNISASTSTKFVTVPKNSLRPFTGQLNLPPLMQVQPQQPLQSHQQAPSSTGSVKPQSPTQRFAYKVVRKSDGQQFTRICKVQVVSNRTGGVQSRGLPSTPQIVFLRHPTQPR